MGAGHGVGVVVVPVEDDAGGVVDEDCICFIFICYFMCIYDFLYSMYTYID